MTTITLPIKCSTVRTIGKVAKRTFDNLIGVGVGAVSVYAAWFVWVTIFYTDLMKAMLGGGMDDAMFLYYVVPAAIGIWAWFFFIIPMIIELIVGIIPDLECIKDDEAHP